MSTTRKFLGGALLGVVLASGVGYTQGGVFPALIEQFWTLIANGGRAFVILDTTASGYHNFGTTLGTNGYGLRDLAGTMQFKNSGGSWAAFIGASGVCGGLTLTGDVTSSASCATQLAAVQTHVTQFVLTGGTVTASTPPITTTQTQNSAGVTFHGVTHTFTETANAAASRYFEILGGAAGTTDEFYVQKGGVVHALSTIVSDNGSLQASNGNNIGWASRGAFTAPSDGVFTAANNAGTDFGRLQLGGTTSSFPSIKRSNGNIEIRLADDSAFANISVNDIGVAPTGQVTWGVGRGSIAASSDAVWVLRNNAASGGVRLSAATDGTLAIQAFAGADTAILKANGAQFTGLASATGVRYVCASTTGVLDGQAAACVGTAQTAQQYALDGWHLPTSSEWTEILALKAELAALRAQMAGGIR